VILSHRNIVANVQSIVGYLELGPTDVMARGTAVLLTEGSAAMDSGDSESAPSMDADGKQRPSGRGADRGAYER
jgi:hypothetical protein